MLLPGGLVRPQGHRAEARQAADPFGPYRQPGRSAGQGVQDLRPAPATAAVTAGKRPSAN